jgi:hypothetical protein
MKYILLIGLFGCAYSANCQINYKNDPMPKVERDSLPKPYILLEVGSNCFCPMVDSNFISIGPNKDHICEVWLLKDYREYTAICEKYNDDNRPLRAWIGQYSWRDFNNWRKF